MAVVYDTPEVIALPASTHGVTKIDTKRCRAILGYSFDGSYERCDSPDHTTENHPKDMQK